MGIIIRQKSMVMYFFLFIIIAFLDYKQHVVMAKRKKMMNDQKIQEEAGSENQYQAGINGL